MSDKRPKKTIKTDWSQRVGYGNPAIADIDQDGKKEIIVSSYGKIWCFKGDGSPLWRTPFFGNSPFPPAVGDITNNGKKETIVLGQDGSLITLNAEGRGLWSEKDLGQGVSHPTIADLSGNGQKEILIVTGGEISVWKGNGEKAWKREISKDVSLRNPQAVGDIDKDGEKEICLIGSSFSAPNKTYLVIVDSKGIIQRKRTFPKGPIVHRETPPILLDFTGNGKLEIGIGGKGPIYLLDSQGGIIWNSWDEKIYGSGGIWIDGQTKEIIFSGVKKRKNEEKRIFRYDLKQGVIWKKLPPIDFIFASQPIVGNFSGDENLDFCFTLIGKYSGRFLIVEREEGKTIWWSERSRSKPSAVSSGDVNGDGKLEICGTDQGVFLLNPKNAGSKAPWPTYAFNTQRTSCAAER